MSPPSESGRTRPVSLHYLGLVAGTSKDVNIRLYGLNAACDRRLQK